MDYKSKYTGYQVEQLLGKAGTSLQSSDISTVATTGSYNDLSNKPIIPDISSKQDILVSGANIKTINGESILGSGDITIEDDNYVKYVTQTLTDEQKTQARTNIGAISKTDLNDIDLSVYETKVDSQNKLEQSKQYTDEQIINVSALVNRLITDTELKFFCIEPVTIIINGNSTVYDTNTLVDIFLNTGDTFEVVPTSNTSIASLYAWPGALGTYYEWLEGVNLFDGVLFNMNNEDLYTKWSQGNQGLYHVQFAQYKNCIFWSDLSYVSDVSKRTNYTMYNSSELPLCYSTIPDNTFKAFYFAYNVTCDPNWSNPAYKESFSKATWATQVFSYYGLHSIGLFDMDSSRFNIVLPKDCRGLMYYAPNILNAGVFDATNTTNFGAKSGSWRDAFAHCYCLSNLYIKNLKVNINISWSPVNQQSIEFILSKAANTSNITIYLSPYTYYRLTDSNKSLAAEKNITLSLISTNTEDDYRFSLKADKTDLENYYTKEEINNLLSTLTNG